MSTEACFRNTARIVASTWILTPGDIGRMEWTSGGEGGLHPLVQIDHRSFTAVFKEKGSPSRTARVG